MTQQSPLMLALDYAFGKDVSQLALERGTSTQRVYQILAREASRLGTHYVLFRTPRMQNVLLDKVRGPARRQFGQANTPEEFYAELLQERENDRIKAYEATA